MLYIVGECSTLLVFYTCLAKGNGYKWMVRVPFGHIVAHVEEEKSTGGTAAQQRVKIMAKIKL